jgi:arylsulfatase A-like enzyme
VPLLANPSAPWPERTLFTHVGRWPKGSPPAALKYANCSVRTPRWHLVSASTGNVKNWMLFDVKADPGERNDIAAQNPQVVTAMDADFDRWWDSVQPGLVNEDAVGPAVNPFKARYWKQFGGGPDSGAVQPELTQSSAPKQGSQPKTARRPNVLFVIADQWRASAFGFAGNHDVKTPFLDHFAAESIRFSNAVSTIPVCSPTRASLLTGQRGLTHGVFMNDVPLSPDAVTFPKLMAKAGYDTGFIGKWHVDGHGRSEFIPEERRQGFQYWKALECTHDYNRSDYYADGPEKLRWKGYDTVAQTDDACQYLRDHAKTEKPFLLCLSWGPPHEPYETAPANFARLYESATLALRPNVPPERRAIALRELRGYYAHCTALDECFGRLMQTCRELGLDENTIVVFTSDHGDMLWSQGLEKKQKPFEESARVPLLLRYPEKFGREGRNTPATIGTEDIMPTLLRLCRLSVPRTAEGLDFSGYLSGGKDPSDGAATVMCPSPFGQWSRDRGGREYRAIRTQRYTYAADLKGPWLLYDNEADPYQRENLVGKPEYAPLQRRMDQWLRRKLKSRKDDFLPAAYYIHKWNYTIDATGTVPYKP